MTTPLTHPAAEDLGRFIEGTLDDPARSAMVAHVADCDECRMSVVDASAFGEELAVPTRFSSSRWLGIAAAFVLVVGAAAIVWNAQRDRVPDLIEASTHLSSRLVAARLAGFPYVKPKTVNRGESGEFDPAAAQLIEKAQEVLKLSGDDAKTLHEKGVAQLLLVEAELPEYTENTSDDQDRRNELAGKRKEGVELLRKAASRASDNAAYQSDLAGALIATGDPTNVSLAVDACNRALQLDRHSLEARFNLAKALDLLGQTSKAIAAYQGYLDVDSSSPWAGEVRDRMNHLKEELSLP